MKTREAHDRARRRQHARVKALRGRAALASALGFAALVGLAGHHAAGAKHRTAVLHARAVETPSSTRFFDESDSSYAFDASAERDARAPQAQHQAAPAPAAPPPVAVTSVS